MFAGVFEELGRWMKIKAWKFIEIGMGTSRKAKAVSSHARLIYQWTLFSIWGVGVGG